MKHPMSDGYDIIFHKGSWMIADETEYFAVYRDYKHIASFKTKDLIIILK